MIEILSIGNEVLSGFTLNSNAAFIGRKLVESGFKVARVTTLSDDKKEIQNGMKEALHRSRFVIATGGLGPTIDDLTRDAARDLFESGEHLDQNIMDYLIKRFGVKHVSFENQATVPDKATPIQNPVGTAPGFIFRQDDKVLFLLPGIPTEMRVMFEQTVLPLILKEAGETKPYFVKRINLFNLPESAVDPALRLIQDAKIELGIYPQAGILNVTLFSQDENKLKAPYEALLKQFKENTFEAHSGKIEEGVHLKLIQLKKTVAFAESCTGGAAMARLVSQPGASEYLLGGIVCYSDQSKIDLLGVDPALIEKHGAVSEEVAKAMALGAQQKLHSDYALAVTGIAGPTGGTADKPVGTVWCAIATPNNVKAWKLSAWSSSRNLIIERSVNALLAELYIQLQK